MRRFAFMLSCLTQRRPLLIVLLGAIVTYFAMQRVVQLGVDTDIIALMPQDAQSVQNLKRVLRKVGSFSNALVIIESSDPDASGRFAESLRERVIRLDWVDSAFYKEDNSVLAERGLLYLPTDELERISAEVNAAIAYQKANINFQVDENEVTINTRDQQGERPSDLDTLMNQYERPGSDSGESSTLLQSRDGRITILVIEPRGPSRGIATTEKLIGELETQINELDPTEFHPEMQVFIGGRIKNAILQYHAALDDVANGGTWAIGSILLLLIFYFRRILVFVYIGIPLVMGLSWSFGIAQVFFSQLNVVTIFLILILFGIGIDFGIHNLSRYLEARRRGCGQLRAVYITISRTGRASLLAAITTALAFYSLLSTDFRAFYEFGFVAGTGVLCTFIAMYTVCPAGFVLSERLALLKPGTRRSARGRTFPLPPAVTTMLATVIVISASSWYLSDLEFENDFGKLTTSLPEEEMLKGKIRQVFSTRSDRAVLYVDSLEETHKVVEYLDAYIEEDTNSPTIDKVRSIVDLVPPAEQQEEKLTVIDDLRGALAGLIDLDDQFEFLDVDERQRIEEAKNQLDIDAIKPEELPSNLRRLYMPDNVSEGYLVYIYNLSSMSKAENAKAFSDDIRQIDVDGRTYYPATEALVFVDMRELMKEDAKNAFFFVLATVLLVLIVSYRSVVTSMLVVSPVLLGMLVMAGLMGYLGIKLSIFNMVVIPTVLGIGIDSSIHIYERYREYSNASLREVMRHTGLAASVAALTTMLGFAGMLTAYNPGLRSLGAVACIGLGAVIVASLVYFPAILSLTHKRTGQLSPSQSPTLQTNRP